MKQPFRVGILGAGAFASRRHLPDLAKDARAEVAAACRRDPAELAKFADHFAIPERYTDWEALLLGDSIDGVVICTPHDQHYAQAKAALERGLHVLLEKPMALEVGQSEELAEIAKNRGLRLAVAFNPPYWRHAQALRAGIAAGRLGKLESVSLHWSGSVAHVFGKAPMPETVPGVVRPTLFRADPKANGGGAMMDGGGHLASELLWITGLEPTSATSVMDDPIQDMRSVTVIELQGGVVATIAQLVDSAYSERRIHSTYDGDKGSGASEGLPFRVKWLSAGSAVETLEEADLPGAPTPVADWLDSIHDNRDPVGSAAHGVAVTRLLAAAYESAKSGRTVRL